MILWIILLKDPNEFLHSSVKLEKQAKECIMSWQQNSQILPFAWLVNDNFTGKLGHFPQAEQPDCDILTCRL